MFLRRDQRRKGGRPASRKGEFLMTVDSLPLPPFHFILLNTTEAVRIDDIDVVVTFKGRWGGVEDFQIWCRK